jgi:uncharacterized protein YdeI (YjbR/CyaY-like superfamily)
MTRRPIETLEVASRGEWRQWLTDHHDSRAEIWLVFRKRHRGGPAVGVGEAIEEALCFGWIDSLVRRLDDDRYARKFTPRKASSRWSTINRRRYADMKARGLLTEAGSSRPPTEASGDAPRPSVEELPGYLERRLKADRKAWRHFERLAPSYQRAYVAWIVAAKREDTRERRLREAIDKLAAGEKLGLK